MNGPSVVLPRKRTWNLNITSLRFGTSSSKLLFLGSRDPLVFGSAFFDLPPGEMKKFQLGNQIFTKLNCLWRIMIFSIDGWKNSYGWKLSYISHPSFWKSWYLKKKILPRSNEIKVRVLHPPKFNIAPEKWWLDDYFPIGKVTFQGLC